jgi:copper chaperone for superoxide dismutase
MKRLNPGSQTLFAVPLHCDGCVKDVSNSLYKLAGVSKVEANLKDQLVSVEGSGEQHGLIYDVRNHWLTKAF